MSDLLLPPAIFLMGPTASGKTALAVDIVKRFRCEIISVDSAMIYRGMDIGTAKPDMDILSIAPHRLIDICDPAESYSAGRFREDALHAMRDITSRGRIPLLVGGTMLYFHALQHGLADLPIADLRIRAKLDARAAEEGWPVLHAELAAVDPIAAARINANDSQRIQRALEIYYVAGRPMSELHDSSAVQTLPYRLIKLAISPSSRGLLHARIEQRFHDMLTMGFVKEVTGLRARGDLTIKHSSMRSVGYRQLWEHLDGACNLETAALHGIVATRRFAKRQLTWLRSETAVHWLQSDAPGVTEDAQLLLKQALAGSP
ncbi:MAG TPA: tRNA (adenosine(37)-N6)-dimethylallyltransferase MiaA [Gammaproteobacteria bacterium]|nr:tRNA (adenosine(37)-N6)-dimethylallyltransferase MiaA [Gammaproteobacteria bacterium]